MPVAAMKTLQAARFLQRGEFPRDQPHHLEMIRRSLLSYQYRSLAPAPLASALPCSPAQRAYSSQPPSTNASPESITLPDGRKLSFARYGATNGYPVFYFHGFPGSRLEARVWADAASKFGANLISIDRPGIGLSTPQPRRTPLDFAKDVQHLAKQLDIPQWYVSRSWTSCMNTSPVCYHSARIAEHLT